MVIHNYSKFDKVKRGDIVYIFEAAFAGEFDLDQYPEDKEIGVLVQILIATENGKSNGTLTGFWVFTEDIVDPSKDELDETLSRELEYFFYMDHGTVDIKKMKYNFNFIQVTDYVNIDHKTAMIKSIDG